MVYGAMKPLRVLPLLVIVLSLSSCHGDDGKVSNEVIARYAALGASDAVGVGADPLENGYVWLVQDWLETRYDSVPLLNTGIPGATADVILVLEVPAALVHEPRIATLWTGPNDLTSGRDANDFDRNLDDILRILADQTNARVFIANVPDLSVLPKYVSTPDPDVTPARVAQWNAIIAARAAQRGAVVVDLFNTPLAYDPVYTASDGYHPSNAGHRLIADTFIATMQATLPASWQAPGLAPSPLSPGTVGFR